MSLQFKGFENFMKSENYIASLIPILSKYLNENMAQVHRSLGSLKNFRDSVIPLAYAFLSQYLNLPAQNESFTLAIYKLLDGLYDEFIDKKPFAYAKSSTQIEAFNLDPNAPVSLVVDGTSVSLTNVTTDGSGHVLITLSTALASGKHFIVVSAGKKAFSGYVVV